MDSGSALATEQGVNRQVAAAMSVSNLSHAFTTPERRTQILHDISFTIPDGQFVCLVGPSGCGKSTVLNLCAHLLPIQEGGIEIYGTQIARIQQGTLGYVSQESNLMPWKTVLENVMLPMRLMGTPKSEARERAMTWLDLVGLAQNARLYPQELSGGMQRRCAVARTLAYEPRLVLMDEPFGALDAITRLALQEHLVKLWSNLNSTVVFVTHDLTEAILLGDRIMVMSTGPGRIIDDIQVPFPRPRDAESVIAEPTYSTIHSRIWALLRGGEE
jgi:NitT/TauT family transport system ATP-binding protein